MFENKDRLDKTNKYKNKKWVVILCVFAFITLSLLGYTIYELNENRLFLEEQKMDLEEELSYMIDKYDIVISDRDSLSEELVKERNSLLMVRDSLSSNVRDLRRYKRLIKILKEEKRELFILADSLDRVNQILISQKQNIDNRLKQEISKNRGLSAVNNDLKTKIMKANKLHVRNMKVEAVSILSGGRVEITTRARRTNNIRVCFTISRNNLAKKGDKDIYVIVATPSDIILNLNPNNFFYVNEEKRNYSFKKRVFYEKDDLDVCVFVPGIREDFTKGKYLIGVFMENQYKQEAEILLN